MPYIKQPWNQYDENKSVEANIANNAVITPSKMKHIEDGITLVQTEMNNENEEFVQEVNGEISKVSAQLDETGDEIKESRRMTKTSQTVISKRKIPVVTFIDDDTRSEVWTRLRPIFTSRNVPCSVATITGRYENPLHITKEQLFSLYQMGWEILGHSFTHPTGQSGLLEYAGDYAKLEYEIGAGCKNILTSLNIESYGFVYPQGGANRDIKEITKGHFDYAFAGEGINDDSLQDTMAIKRIALGSFTESNPTINGNSEKNTLAYYKACIDYAIANKAWLVFMTHIHSQDVSQDTIIGQVIDYALSLSVNIMNPKDAHEIHGNRYFAGDVSTGQYMIVDKNNLPRSAGGDLTPGIKSIRLVSGAKPLNDLIETYEDKSITYMQVTASQASAAGVPGGAGYFITYRFITTSGYNRQEKWDYITNDKYSRFVNVDGTWSAWEYSTKFKTKLVSVPQASVPANSYLDVKIPLVGVRSNTTQISGNPSFGLDTGLFYNVTVMVNDEVTIRYLNMATSERVISTRNWLFSYVVDAR